MSDSCDNTKATPQKKSKKDKQRAFLDAFSQHGNVLLSAQAAGINRATVYKWLEHDSDFSFAFNQAKEDAKDVLRAEIYRRAVEGWDEKVYQIGKYAGTVRKYSDTLLIFQAKALMSEYREKQQVTVDGTLTIATEWGGGALDEEEVVDAHNRS